MSASADMQEGEIPRARVGHSIISGPLKSTILLFGGEATSHGWQKLGGVHEGNPKPDKEGMVWKDVSRAPINAGQVTADNSEADTAPCPRSFHAACEAKINGTWAMIVHGGVDDRSMLLDDLWAYRVDNGSGSGRWEHLQAEGGG